MPPLSLDDAGLCVPTFLKVLDKVGRRYPRRCLAAMRLGWLRYLACFAELEIADAYPFRGSLVGSPAPRDLEVGIRHSFAELTKSNNPRIRDKAKCLVDTLVDKTI